MYTLHYVSFSFLKCNQLKRRDLETSKRSHTNKLNEYYKLLSTFFFPK